MFMFAIMGGFSLEREVLNSLRWSYGLLIGFSGVKVVAVKLLTKQKMTHKLFWVKINQLFLIKRNSFNFFTNPPSSQLFLIPFSFRAIFFISFFRYSFRILSFSCEYALTYSRSYLLSFSFSSSLCVLYVSKFISHYNFISDSSFLFCRLSTLLLFRFSFSCLAVKVEILFYLSSSDKLNEFAFYLYCFSNFHRSCLFSFDSKYSLFSKFSFSFPSALFFYTISSQSFINLQYNEGHQPYPPLQLPFRSLFSVAINSPSVFTGYSSRYDICPLTGCVFKRYEWVCIEGGEGLILLFLLLERRQIL